MSVNINNATDTITPTTGTLTVSSGALTLGVAGTAQGSLALSGATSGTFSLAAAAAAGTGYGFNHSGNNTTQSNVALIATSGDTNTNVVFTPKGNGAFVLGSTPDGTATGGNARGQYAVDLQISRSLNNQIASGNYSSILGGLNNKVTGYAGVAAGQQSFIYGNYSTGFGLQTYDQSRYGGLWQASGFFASLGDAQQGFSVLRASTSATSAATLTSDGSSASSANIINLVNNSAMRLTIDIVGRDTTNNNTGFWKLEAGIKRGSSAATTAIVGTVIPTVVALDSGWSTQTTPTLTADTTNGGLNLSVTPITSNACHWVARVLVVEVA
jgi:hypothetical protein